MDDHYGSWMHDAFNDIMPDRFWVTRHNDTFYIYEYKSKEDFKNNTALKKKLPYAFQVGNLRITNKEMPLIIHGRNDFAEKFKNLARFRFENNFELLK